MSTTATAENLTLKISRFIKAPRERVFEAWTNPEQLMRWMGPGASFLTEAKTDLRVGGRYDLKMNTTGCHGGDGPGIVGVGGVYKEIQKPSKIVFTWAWSDNPRDGGDETTVTVDLVEVQGGTQLTLTHEGFATVESRDAHNDGWTGTIVKLERLADKECHSMTPGNFSWNELITTDTEKAGGFYTKLFGWETQPMPGMPYTIYKNGNEYAGGMMQAQQGRSMWVAYVTVENTNATLTEALKLGAKACIEPKDIPGVGRIAVFEDPTGAIIGIWQRAQM